MEKIRFAVLLCIRRFQTSEKVNSVLCCTALGKQRHDWIPRACQDARKHIAWLQSDARQSAGKGCLSGICRGRETHSYNDRSCRGGNTTTALLCRYGMTLDLLFESVNGNIIIQMRNRPWWQLFGNSEWFKQMTSDRFIEGKLSQFVAYCAFRVLSAYIFEDYMQKAGFHVAKFNHRHSRWGVCDDRSCYERDPCCGAFVPFVLL